MSRPGTEAPADEDRLVLYMREGCHLCDVAREVVERVAAEAGAGWHEVDVDHGTAADRLGERYGELVPVVTVDGVQQGYWTIDPDRLRRALASERA